MPRKDTDETKRNRETYRCSHCGKWIRRDTDGFFDRANREDESSDILVFCSEAHADAFHTKKV